MPTTVQTIIDNAYAKSAAARPQSFESSSELVVRVGECLKELFQVMGRENPTTIGEEYQMTFDGSGWPRPTGVDRIQRVYADVGTIAAPPIALGASINVVPFDDRLICEGEPSLYEFGQKFRPVGQTMDPSGGTITIQASRQPILPTVATDDVDPLLPTQFLPILEYDLAGYMAAKEQRESDTTLFFGQKGAIVAQLVDWCRQPTYAVQQRFPMVTPPQTNVDGGRQGGAPSQGGQ